jgi:hypothetical protein
MRDVVNRECLAMPIYKTRIPAIVPVQALLFLEDFQRFYSTQIALLMQ